MLATTMIMYVMIACGLRCSREAMNCTIGKTQDAEHLILTDDDTGITMAFCSVDCVIVGNLLYEQCHRCSRPVVGATAIYHGHWVDMGGWDDNYYFCSQDCYDRYKGENGYLV